MFFHVSENVMQVYNPGVGCFFFHSIVAPDVQDYNKLYILVFFFILFMYFCHWFQSMFVRYENQIVNSQFLHVSN